MSEFNISKYELYKQFAQNREISYIKRVIPFSVTFGLEMPPGILIAANPQAAAALIEGNPPLSAALMLATAALIGTGLNAWVQVEDITRVSSRNGRIARQIGQIEGRDPQTNDEVKKEIENAKKTVTLASRISPTPGHLFDLWFDHYYAKFRSRKHPESLEERAVSDRRLRKWMLQYMDRDEMGYTAEPQRMTDALILAERRWTGLIEDEGQPEYKRRYGELMREEIRKKLAEHLASPAWGEFDRRRVRYEKMSPFERGEELKRLIGEFPNNNLVLVDEQLIAYEKMDEAGLDEDFIEGMRKYDKERAVARSWERRDKSPEKKKLIEQIRTLLTYSPTTRGFQEILLRNLSSLYNYGLESYSWQVGVLIMDTPILNLIGLGDDPEYSDLGRIFHKGSVEEAERRLFGFEKEKSKPKFEPFYYENSDIENPVRRWLANRREEAFELVGFILGRILPEPRLERSWRWQYEAKYKRKLKPL